RHLASFPTRRSSDLSQGRSASQAAQRSARRPAAAPQAMQFPGNSRKESSTSLALTIFFLRPAPFYLHETHKKRVLHGLAGSWGFRRRRDFVLIGLDTTPNPQSEGPPPMVEPKALSLFWEGFELHDYSELSEDSLLLRLQPRADRRPRCSGCGQSCSRVHDTTLRRVRERDLFD